MREEITLHCAKAFPPFWLSRKAGVKNHFFTQKPLYIKWKSRLVENDFEMDRKTEIGQIPQQPKLNSHCSMMLSKKSHMTHVCILFLSAELLMQIQTWPRGTCKIQYENGMSAMFTYQHCSKIKVKHCRHPILVMKIRPGICVKYFLSLSQKNLSPEKTETN